MTELNSEKEKINANDLSEMRKWEKRHRRGKVCGGLLIVVAGSLFLARELGVELPDWLFTWKTLLIGIGLVMGISHGFRTGGWFIPLFIGGAFLAVEFYPEMNLKAIIWPVLLIMMGLLIMFKPRRKARCRKRWRRHNYYRYRHRNPERGNYRSHEYNFDMFEVNTDEDFIDSTSVFGGVKKIVMSKNFKGGDITNIFGGSELNLTQADFEGKVTLEITQVFGGTRLIVPSNWQIKSTAMTTVLGSIEDKRPVLPVSEQDPKKILVLTGTTVFGGIDIRSY